MCCLIFRSLVKKKIHINHRYNIKNSILDYINIFPNRIKSVTNHRNANEMFYEKKERKSDL